MVSQALTRTHSTLSPQSWFLMASTTLARAASFSSGAHGVLEVEEDHVRRQARGLGHQLLARPGHGEARPARQVTGACGHGADGTSGPGDRHRPRRSTAGAIRRRPQAAARSAGSELLGEQPAEAGGVAPDEAPAEAEAFDVAEDVGPPGGVGQESHGLHGPGPGHEPPPGQVVETVSASTPSSLSRSGGVGPDRSERLAAPGDRGQQVGVVGDPEGPEVGGDHGFRAGAGDHFEPEVGQALGQQALRGADQEDRLLQPAPAPDQARPPCGCARCGGPDRPHGPPDDRARWTAPAGRR